MRKNRNIWSSLTGQTSVRKSSRSTQCVLRAVAKLLQNLLKLSACSFSGVREARLSVGCWQPLGDLMDLMLHFSTSPRSKRGNFLVKLLWDKSLLNCNCNLLFKNTHFSEVYKSSSWTSTEPNFTLQPLCFLDLNYRRLPSFIPLTFVRSMGNVLCAFWQEHSIIHTTDTTVCNNSGRGRGKQGSLAYLQRKIMYFTLLHYNKVLGFFPIHIWKGSFGRQRSHFEYGEQSQRHEEEGQKKLKLQLALSVQFCHLLSQPDTPALCSWDHISLGWGSHMPGVISALQNPAAHSTDCHLKEGAIWKPISKTDVSSFLPRLAMQWCPWHFLPQQTDAPRNSLSAQQSWPHTAWAASRVVSIPWQKPGTRFIESHVLLSLCQLWDRHLGHSPSMKTGSALLVENCSSQKISAATRGAEK